MFPIRVPFVPTAPPTQPRHVWPLTAAVPNVPLPTTLMFWPEATKLTSNSPHVTPAITLARCLDFSVRICSPPRTAQLEHLLSQAADLSLLLCELPPLLVHHALELFDAFYFESIEGVVVDCLRPSRGRGNRFGQDPLDVLGQHTDLTPPVAGLPVVEHADNAVQFLQALIDSSDIRLEPGIGRVAERPGEIAVAICVD